MTDEPEKKKPGRLAQAWTAAKVAAVIAGSASSHQAPTQSDNASVCPARAPVVASTEAKEYADMQKVNDKDRSRRAAELGYALRKPEQEIVQPRDPAPQRRGRR